MIAETYTANNREGQTWLILDEPLVIRGQFNKRENETLDEAMARHNEEKDILLTDHLPDGTKVRGDEIEVKWQYFNTASKTWLNVVTLWLDIFQNRGIETRQVATLKQKREVVDDIESVATNWFMRTGYRPNDDYKAYLMGFKDALMYAKSLGKLDKQN